MQYNPGQARWTTRDPLGMVDGPNLYAYAGGNPVIFTDPLGLSWWDNFRDRARRALCRLFPDSVFCINPSPQCPPPAPPVPELPAAPTGVWLDRLQTGLDVAGWLPGLGIFADGANAAIHLARGNWRGAATSAFAMIPGIEDAAGIYRLGRRSVEMAGMVRHHGTPRAILRDLPAHVRTNPNVRGRRGNPNRVLVDEDAHIRAHTSTGTYFPGGDYNRDFDRLIREGGEYENMTETIVNEIRAQLLREYFGL